MIAPGFGVVHHPMRRMSEDEMRSRSLCDLEDPNAVFPDHCSACRNPASLDNPLRLVPVNRSGKALARAYLYKSICARCSARGVK